MLYEVPPGAEPPLPLKENYEKATIILTLILLQL